MKIIKSMAAIILAFILALPAVAAVPWFTARADGVEVSATVSPNKLSSAGSVECVVTISNETDMVLENVSVNYPGHNATMGNMDPGESQSDEGMLTVSENQLGTDIPIDVNYSSEGYKDAQRVYVKVEREKAAAPSVSFTRSSSAKTASAGDSVTLTYDVKNNSSEAITGVTISDPAANAIASGDTINAGQSKSYKATVTVNNDVTSSPKLTYNFGGQSYDASVDPMTIAVNKASLSITATADKTTVNKGDSVNFTIKLNNTGSANVNKIKLVDDKGEVIRSSASVNAGASPTVTYAINFEETRKVVFTATYPSGSETATAMSDPIEIKVEGSEPAGEGKLTIANAETDPAEPVIPGNVTLKVTVKNDGDATLTNIIVNEAKLGRVGTVAELLPGASKEVSKQTRLEEETEFEISATASDDNGNSYESDTKNLAVVGSIAEPSSSVSPTISPSATPKPTRSDGLRTMLIAIVVIVILIIVAGIALVVLVVKERKEKKRLEEEGEDPDGDDDPNHRPINKDNPQQVAGSRKRRPEDGPPPKRRPDGEQPRRRPDGEQPPRRRPPEGQQQRRPVEGERRPIEGELPRRRPQQPREDIDRTQVIPAQYRNQENTQEIPAVNPQRDADDYYDDYNDERPRRKRTREDGYYEEERPRRRRDDYDYDDGYYEDNYEEPRRRRDDDDYQQPRPKTKPKRRPESGDDINYGPPKRRK